MQSVTMAPRATVLLLTSLAVTVIYSVRDQFGDITHPRDTPYAESGDTIHPELMDTNQQDARDTDLLESRYIAYPESKEATHRDSWDTTHPDSRETAYSESRGPNLPDRRDTTLNLKRDTIHKRDTTHTKKSPNSSFPVSNQRDNRLTLPDWLEPTTPVATAEDAELTVTSEDAELIMTSERSALKRDTTHTKKSPNSSFPVSNQRDNDLSLFDLLELATPAVTQEVAGVIMTSERSALKRDTSHTKKPPNSSFPVSNQRDNGLSLSDLLELATPAVTQEVAGVIMTSERSALKRDTSHTKKPPNSSFPVSNQRDNGLFLFDLLELATPAVTQEVAGVIMTSERSALKRDTTHTKKSPNSSFPVSNQRDNGLSLFDLLELATPAVTSEDAGVILTSERPALNPQPRWSPTTGTFRLNLTNSFLRACMLAGRKMVTLPALDGEITLNVKELLSRGDVSALRKSRCVVTMTGAADRMLHVRFRAPKESWLFLRMSQSSPLQDTQPWGYNLLHTAYSTKNDWDGEVYSGLGQMVWFIFEFNIAIDFHSLLKDIPIALNFSWLDRSYVPALETVFLDSTAGYIATPRYDGITTSIFASHDLWGTLHVPPGLLVMISIADEPDCIMMIRHIIIYLLSPRRQLDTCKTDFPLIVKTPMMVIKFPKDAMQKQWMSKVKGFKLEFTFLYSGFKLLFTFHDEEAPILRPEGGRWNCRVRDWAPFQLHFPCNLHADCLGGEDEAVCPYTSDLCGLGQFTVDGKCYSYTILGPDIKISWMKADVDCRSRGGRLASLNTFREWEAVMDTVRRHGSRQRQGFVYTTKANIYLGLKTVPDNMPQIYVQAWQHADASIAYYVPGNHLLSGKTSKPACYYVNLFTTNQAMIDYPCFKPHAGSYICEQTVSTRVSHPKTEVTLQQPETRLSTVFSARGFVTCPQQHVTHNFLSCDIHTACWSHQTSCSSPVTPLPPSFVCADGDQRAPYTLVCDFRSDCGDNSDEDFCQYSSCNQLLEFECQNGQCFPYAAICDGVRHCLDGSDEQCPTETLMYKTLVKTAAVVIFDAVRSAALRSDEEGSGEEGSGEVRSLNEIFKDFLNFEDEFVMTLQLEPLPNNSAPGGQAPSRLVCPANHFACDSAPYCLPVFVRCNRVYDCPGREDEAGCGSYTCPGLYRCRGSSVCVTDAEVCDGTLHCPQRDDELLCDLRCPEGCTCHGLAFFCNRGFKAADFPSLRFLDASGSGLRPEDVLDNGMLVHLSLAACGLTDTPRISLHNLHSLDLRDNHLTEVTTRHLSRLPNLRHLSLAHNPLVTLFSRRAVLPAVAPPTLMSSTQAPPNPVPSAIYPSTPAPSSPVPPTQALPTAAAPSTLTLSTVVPPAIALFVVAPPTVAPPTLAPPSVAPPVVSQPTLAPPTATPPSLFPRLHSLDLSGVKMTSLRLSVLDPFPNLRALNLSGTGLDSLSGTGRDVPAALRTLDVRACPLTYFPADLLRNVTQLNDVWADTYKLCCPQTLPPGFHLARCRAPADEISSCENLLRSHLYRTCLAVFAATTLLGNLAAFVARLAKVKKGFDVFTLTLCVSDFLMGLYLAIIGVADRRYMSYYLWNDVTWRRSAACSVAGFLSLVSNEVSAFVVCLITLDRFLVLRFPFSSVRLTRTSGLLVSGGVGVVGAALASVPFLPPAAHWHFYSLNGMCVPLPVTRKEFPGRAYSFGLLVVLNFVLFVLIAAGQLCIYLSVQRNTLQHTDLAARQAGRERDARLARRLIAVAMSDFLCWFPIGLLGILSSSGYPISGEVNVAMAIFVLPLNSAINPYLYTVNTLLEKRRIRSEKRLMEVLIKRLKHGADDVTHRA